MADKKFHVDNEVIITTNDAVDVEEVFNHLCGRLNEFREKSEFIFICGYHTKETGKIGAIAHDLQYDYQHMMERFYDHKNYPEIAIIAEKKQFGMGTPIFLNTKRDRSLKSEEVYSLAESTKQHIEIKFKEVLFKEVPIVLVLASCYSYNSDIFYILRATGLCSAIRMLEENRNITHGKLIHLDDDQRKLLDDVANGEIKDVIVGGKCVQSRITRTFIAGRDIFGEKVHSKKDYQQYRTLF